jgi:CHAD domain-containing protein
VTDSESSSAPEVERKFRVHGLYRMPSLLTTGAVADLTELPELTLDATYYDTSDLRLAREGVTLRRRLGGHDEGWHLKLPAGMSGVKASSDALVREEIALPLGEAEGESPEPPEYLRGLVRAIVREDTLRPVATLRTQRHPTEVSGDVAGRQVVLAVLTDDVVSVVDVDGTVAARFREIELEDVSVDPAGIADEAAVTEADVESARAEMVAAVSEVLVGAGAVGGEFVSKAVRALGPFATAPPEIPEPAPVAPPDPAREAIAAHIARHARALRRADVMVRRDQHDSVHQMRVAARRLRSGLKVFSPLLEAEWADELRAELAWVASTLGDYRDAEVLLHRLECHLDLITDVDPEPARALVRHQLQLTMSRAREEALEMLDSKRYLQLQSRLVAAAASPQTLEVADQTSAAVLPPLASKTWRKLAKECDRLVAAESSKDGAPDEEWHETRILAKKARYAVEALAPVFGRDAAAFAKKLSQVTEVLGEHQDAAIAKERVHELGTTADTDPQAAFVMGVLRGVEQDCADAQRDVFVELWPEVRKPRWRRWLDA